MNNCLLAKFMNTLEVSNLLLVGVLSYGTQQLPLRCLSFYGLLKGIRYLLLTKLLFWTRFPFMFKWVWVKCSFVLIICFKNTRKFWLLNVIIQSFTSVPIDRTNNVGSSLTYTRLVNFQGYTSKLWKYFLSSFFVVKLEYATKVGCLNPF